MREQISLGITLNPIIIPRDLYPMEQRTLTQEDMDRVWKGEKLPETFRKGPWKYGKQSN